MSVNEKMTAIAEAIREKTNGTDPLTLDDMASSIPEVYENGYDKGYQAQYDEFWDAYQDYGNQQSYSTSFKGTFWKDMNFNPKYKMKPTEMYEAFAGCAVTDGYEILKEKLDLSVCKDIRYVFSNSALSHLPILMLTGDVDGRRAGFVENMQNLHTIDLIVIGDTIGNAVFKFGGDKKLKEIRFQGTIYFPINIQYSPLSVDSMKSIISCLKNFIGTDEEYLYKVSFSSNCWKALEESGTAPNGGTWKEYVQGLGWLI